MTKTPSFLWPGSRPRGQVPISFILIKPTLNVGKQRLFYWAVVVVKWSACSPSTPTIRVWIPLMPTVFSVKFEFEGNENKQKRPGLAHLKKFTQCQLLSYSWHSGRLQNLRSNVRFRPSYFLEVFFIPTVFFLKMKIDKKRPRMS